MKHRKFTPCDQCNGEDWIEYQSGKDRGKRQCRACNRLRNILHHMKQRCYDSNWENYKYYGGRGITICDDWLNSNISFIKWSISNGYKHGLWIDRINCDGNYTPDNCRFIAITESQRNKRPYGKVPFTGVSQRGNKFIARIMVDGKRIYLGRFLTPEEAGEAFLVADQLRRQGVD